MDVTGSELCPVAGCSVNGVELTGSAITVLELSPS
jgi:hypothetical protein